MMGGGTVHPTVVFLRCLSNTENHELLSVLHAMAGMRALVPSFAPDLQTSPPNHLLTLRAIRNRNRLVTRGGKLRK